MRFCIRTLRAPVPSRAIDIDPEAAFFTGKAAEDWVFDDYERARARALSEYLAIAADQHPAVTEFRDRTLGGNLLSPEEALNVLNTPESLTEDLRGLGLHTEDSRQRRDLANSRVADVACPYPLNFLL